MTSEIPRHADRPEADQPPQGDTEFRSRIFMRPWGEEGVDPLYRSSSVEEHKVNPDLPNPLAQLSREEAIEEETREKFRRKLFLAFGSTTEI